MIDRKPHRPRRRPPARGAMVAVALIAGLIGVGGAAYWLIAGRTAMIGGPTVVALPPGQVASVNGQPILRPDFEQEVERATGTALEAANAEQQRRVLSQMIDEALLSQSGAVASAPPPDDATLQRYYADHRDRYRTAGSLSVRDWTLPATDAVRAGQAVAAIRDGMPPDDAASVFDLTPSGKLGRGDLPEAEVKAKLGDRLYDAAATLVDGSVSKPIAEDGRLHILYLVRRKPAKPAEFAAVREAVLRDYQRDQRLAANRAALDALRGHADIQVAPELGN